MIGQLRGKIGFRGDRFVILDVGGVGYKVYLSGSSRQTLPRQDETVLWTYLAVRENALELYGFVEKNELDLFELLLTVSGVGPKSALAILSLSPSETLKKAIQAGDADYLTRVSGIGRKTAEKIIVELRDKLDASIEAAPHLQEEAEALEALRALGFGLKEAREALQQSGDETTDAVGRIKAALKHLSRK